MRKIVSALGISLDGVVEAPWTWPFDRDRDKVDDLVWSIFAMGDAMLLGRITYEELAGFWPPQTGERADHMNNLPKYVVSTTLKTADWTNSTLISSNAAEELTKVKQQPGKNINVTGSATLVRWLLRERLLDQLNLLLYPGIVGSGKRLFEGEGDQMALNLTRSNALSNGVVHLTYEPA
jgi:dihydrofolate reductase